MAPPHTSPSPRWLAPVAAAVAVRPALWGTAVRQLLALAVPGWWRRAPHLPLPSPSYLRFRLLTAYGDPGSVPPPGDVVTYLAWCRDERRRGTGRRRVRPAGITPLRAMAGR